MMPEKFRGEYQDLLNKYCKEVIIPINECEKNLIKEFKKKYNLSMNQISLLEGEPPF